MAEAVATPPAVDTTLADRLTTLEKANAERAEAAKSTATAIDALTKSVQELAKTPDYKGASPALLGGQPPNVTKQLGERPYSFGKAMGFATGAVETDKASEEIQISLKLRKLYSNYSGADGGGFSAHNGRGLLIPIGVDYLPPSDSTEVDNLKAEIRQKMLAGGQTDQDEAIALAKKYPQYAQKAFGTVSDVVGGSLVGFPQLMELIELQRNLEVFAQAGASEIALPANGRMSFPKQTGATTAYWVGEAAAITASDPATGSLLLEAKKCAVLTKVNNELFRYASPTAENLLRMDMARVLALKIDLAMLEGTGGTQPKGLLTYSDIGSITATTVGATGNTFEPEDVGRMEGALPDAIPEPTAYVMRRNMSQALANRRADAVSAGDKKGAFMFSMMRDQTMGIPKNLGGAKLVRSAQVSATRSKGGVSTLTYILCGAFYEWITARLGVMEVLASSTGDTPLVNDQTWVRGIQHIDAGPRHAASFVLCDTLVIA